MFEAQGQDWRARARPDARGTLVTMVDDVPDARDGLTRKERVVLWVLRRAESERKGRGVRAAMLYGRVLEHIDMSREEFMSIVERLSGVSTPLLVRSQQSPSSGRSKRH
jgi:hypothetical protein